MTRNPSRYGCSTYWTPVHEERRDRRMGERKRADVREDADMVAAVDAV
jgi:hypothetical protein